MRGRSALSRRAVLAGAVAAGAGPLIAQADPWAGLADQARALDQCHALMVMQAGRTVLRERVRGPALDRAVPIKSVSKTIVAALLGAALDRGELPDVAARLGDLAPGLIPPGADARVRDLTLEHLVTMQTGLERTSGANYGAWVNSGNWVADALGRPFVGEPGRGMQYSTGSFHVLGAVLSVVSGQSLLALARDRIGGPLGVDVPAWVRDPQGRYLGGNEMALTLDGMARFGEMYRLRGQHGGARVLSAAYVARSFVPRTRSEFSGLEYGYGWFLGHADGVRFALARGYGGQVICVVPELDMTLALTSDPARPARSAGYFGDLMRLITRAAIPAAASSIG